MPRNISTLTFILPDTLLLWLEFFCHIPHLLEFSAFLNLYVSSESLENSLLFSFILSPGLRALSFELENWVQLCWITYPNIISSCWFHFSLFLPLSFLFLTTFIIKCWPLVFSFSVSKLGLLPWWIYFYEVAWDWLVFLNLSYYFFNYYISDTLFFFFLLKCLCKRMRSLLLPTTISLQLSFIFSVSLCLSAAF